MLKIRIYSFGYKKSGIPEDSTSNKGGFVFDCRFIYNPGRKTEFTELTGKDKPVADFLDNQPEMQCFLKNTFGIISAAIENYISRNFTDLMVCYGCTGGQHRSVYASEKLKTFILEKFSSDISIQLTHKEFPQYSS